MADNVLAAAQGLVRRWHREKHFYATVVDESGDTVQIRRDGQSVPDPTFYRAASGVAALVTAGDRVYVADVTGDGGYLVVCKVP